MIDFGFAGMRTIRLIGAMDCSVRLISLLLLLGLTAACSDSATDGGEPEDGSVDVRAPAGTEWVTPGDDGRLVYATDPRGNRVPDFSHAGYGGGGVALPEVPTVIALMPTEGDQTGRLQEAIDAIAAREPRYDGFRGALELGPGTFEVAGTVRITTGGIVLRGSGQGEDGTVIFASGDERRTVIEVTGEGNRREVSGTRRKIVDAYVPVGERSFQVEEGHTFAPGDTVIVHRPGTGDWISAIGMDRIPPRADGRPVNQWRAERYGIDYDRVVESVDGDRITLDAPLFNAIDERFGGGYVYTYTFPGRIRYAGIEDVRGVSDFSGEPEDDDEDHAWVFIDLEKVEHAWIRNVTSRHFGFGLARALRYSKWVTIQDSICLDPVSEVRGGRRYPVYLSGQFALVQRCYANFSRHDFGLNSQTHGPNVFLDCFGEESFADTGPHHRWATGALFDNVRVPNHGIRIQNRLNLGSGHGWAGANMVVWNSEAGDITLQNPPTAQNWGIGNIGPKRDGYGPGEDAYWQSHGERVRPESLYLQQLRERLGEEAMANIAPPDDLPIAERLDLSRLWGI